MGARRDEEHAQQSLLFQWATLATGRYPELGLLFAVPNFARVNVRYGARMKREGKKAGVPDVWLPVPRGRYVGCVGEMKVKPNRVTDEQEKWLEALAGCGWSTHVWWSWEEAKDALETYLRAAA